MTLILLLLLGCVHAVTTDRVCCFAPVGGDFADECTRDIPRDLCTRAGGLIEAMPTQAPAPTSAPGSPTADPQARCCCYGRNPRPVDRCLDDVLVSVCTGPSVQGTCEPVVVQEPRCCCKSPRTEFDELCVPNILVALCLKTEGAQCIGAVTQQPSEEPESPCLCVLPDQPADIELSEEMCEKFNGVCRSGPTPAPPPTDCCCIWEGNMADPLDPEVPANNQCIVNVPINECETGKKRGAHGKRSGVCWTGPLATAGPGPVPTAAPGEPMCVCEDPQYTDRRPLLDEFGNDALIPRYMCEFKLRSRCVQEPCCCKFFTAPDEPCQPLSAELCVKIPGGYCEARVESPCDPACATGSTCVEGVCVGSGALQFTLTWSKAGDGDIWLTIPTGETISWQQRSASGGLLDVDDTTTTGPENIFWAADVAPPIGVFHVCAVPYLLDLSTPVAWTVTVRQGETVVSTFTGLWTIEAFSVFHLVEGGSCDPSDPSYAGSFDFTV